MIVKARAHGNAGALARYLERTKEHEASTVLELRDSATDDLTEALTDWEAIARSKTKGEKALYHAHIRLRDGERLHDAQWLKTVEELEKRLGLTNSARAIVAHDHEEKGRHLHIVWSRLDPIREKLATLSNDRKHHHAVAREAEKEFGLTPVVDKPQRKRRLSDREIRALKDRGVNREKLEKMVRAAWDACDSGQETKAMLNALGVDITAGDRRDWVVDYKGLKVNPVRLLEGVNAGQFRERMKDVDLERERMKQQDRAPAMFGKKSAWVIRSQFDKSIANDQESPVPKSGFRKKKHRAPTPRLRPKVWHGDPGI